MNFVIVFLMMFVNVFAYGMDKAEKPKKSAMSEKKELALIEKREQCGVMLEKLFRIEYADSNFVKEVRAFLETISVDSNSIDTDQALCKACIKNASQNLKQKAEDRFNKQKKLKSLIFQEDISDIDSEFSELLSTGATLDFTYEECGMPEEGSLLLLIAHYHNVLTHVQYLHKKGAFVNANNDIGVTPLMVAAQSCNTESDKILKYLIESGAMVNQKSAYGNTSLVYLMSSFVSSIKHDHMNESSFNEYERYIDKINLLLTAGASLKISNQEGVNAFDLIKNCINMDDRYAKKFAKFVYGHEILSKYFIKDNDKLVKKQQG